MGWNLQACECADGTETLPGLYTAPSKETACGEYSAGTPLGTLRAQYNSAPPMGIRTGLNVSASPVENLRREYGRRPSIEIPRGEYKPLSARHTSCGGENNLRARAENWSHSSAELFQDLLVRRSLDSRDNRQLISQHVFLNGEARHLLALDRVGEKRIVAILALICTALDGTESLREKYLPHSSSWISRTGHVHMEKPGDDANTSVLACEIERDGAVTLKIRVETRNDIQVEMFICREKPAQIVVVPHSVHDVEGFALIQVLFQQHLRRALHTLGQGAFLFVAGPVSMVGYTKERFQALISPLSPSLAPCAPADVPQVEGDELRVHEYKRLRAVIPGGNVSVERIAYSSFIVNAQAD
jgi:hypothetical protein